MFRTPTMFIYAWRYCNGVTQYYPPKMKMWRVLCGWLFDYACFSASASGQRTISQSHCKSKPFGIVFSLHEFPNLSPGRWNWGWLLADMLPCTFQCFFRHQWEEDTLDEIICIQNLRSVCPKPQFFRRGSTCKICIVHRYQAVATSFSMGQE